MTQQYEKRRTERAYKMAKAQYPLYPQISHSDIDGLLWCAEICLQEMANMYRSENSHYNYCEHNLLEKGLIPK